MELPRPPAKSLWQPALFLSAALAACLAMRPVLSQTPTIEELEKRIEEAKKAKEPAAAQPKPEKEQASAGVPAKQGTLIIGNDAPCLLSIDRERIADALPAGAREMTVQRGERAIECTSSEEPTVSVSQVVRIKPGQKTFVELQLKDKVAAAAQRRNAIAREHEEKRRQNPSKPVGTPGPFDPLAGGLLRDDGSGLIWSDSDNGEDISWDDAVRYCNHRGMRLPTVAQLQGLVDRSGAMATPCQTKQCKVSERFHLTGNGYWSRQRQGVRWAIFVTLDNGRRSFDHIGVRNDLRALCVRGA